MDDADSQLEIGFGPIYDYVRKTDNDPLTDMLIYSKSLTGAPVLIMKRAISVLRKRI
jgi:hypothetical protein